MIEEGKVEGKFRQNGQKGFQEKVILELKFEFDKLVL